MSICQECASRLYLSLCCLPFTRYKCLILTNCLVWSVVLAMLSATILTNCQTQQFIITDIHTGNWTSGALLKLVYVYNGLERTDTQTFVNQYEAYQATNPCKVWHVLLEPGVTFLNPKSLSVVYTILFISSLWVAVASIIVSMFRCTSYCLQPASRNVSRNYTGLLNSP